MSANWTSEASTYEHTFSTGRTAVLRRRVQLLRLARAGEGETLSALDRIVEGERLTDPQLGMRVMDQLVAALFVTPRVYLPDQGEEPLERDLEAGELPDVTVEDLEDEEVMEALELALASLREADRFRRLAERVAGGPDGEDVADAPKRPARARARKP